MLKYDERDERRRRRRKVRSAVSWSFGVVALVGFFSFVFLTPKVANSALESTNGIHYHPRLTITLNGEKITIPNNIGIGVTHNPIHTHEEGDGTIHLEFEGRVLKDDTRLGKFFSIWGKEWTPTSFMGLPIDADHTLTMKVNGAPSTEFGNLLMKDKQEIELDYR